MSINILPGTDETLDAMKGESFTPHKGEGIVYLKLVMIKPDTIQEDPKGLIEDAPAVILCGPLNKIRHQIDKWFSESMKEYAK
jgi:hypothetical protein